MLSEEERGKVRELVVGFQAMRATGCINFGLCLNRLKIAELEREIEQRLAAEGFAVQPVELATRTPGPERTRITIQIENLPEYFHKLDRLPASDGRPLVRISHQCPPSGLWISLPCKGNRG